MNRKELVAAIAEAAELEQKTVESVLKSLQSTIEGAVAKGEKVSVPGFLALSVGARAAREGRNPATGEAIKIPATKAVKLSDGSQPKQAPAHRGAGTHSGLGVVIFEEPVRAADVTDVLEESFEHARTVSSRLDAASSRLVSTSPAVLAALEQLSMTLPAGVDDPTLSLTDDEESVLRETGSLAQPFPPISARASFRSTAKLTALLSGALTVKDAAAQLGVSTGRVRQRLIARTLLGVQEPGGWRLPQFQFEPAGGQIRGLNGVLPTLPESMHVLSVFGFLTKPSIDLVLDDGDSVSPIEWLRSGGQIDAVVALADDFARR